jgi:hypothetical protein
VTYGDSGLVKQLEVKPRDDMNNQALRRLIVVRGSITLQPGTERAIVKDGQIGARKLMILKAFKKSPSNSKSIFTVITIYRKTAEMKIDAIFIPQCVADFRR